MNRAWKALQGDGIAMLAINVAEDQQALAAFNKDFPIDSPEQRDAQGNTSRRW